MSDPKEQFIRSQILLLIDLQHGIDALHIVDLELTKDEKQEELYQMMRATVIEQHGMETTQ